MKKAVMILVTTFVVACSSSHTEGVRETVDERQPQGAPTRVGVEFQPERKEGVVVVQGEKLNALTTKPKPPILIVERNEAPPVVKETPKPVAPPPPPPPPPVVVKQPEPPKAPPPSPPPPPIDWDAIRKRAWKKYCEEEGGYTDIEKEALEKDNWVVPAEFKKGCKPLK